ncbi:MAG: hypothetical protein V4690_02975 [Patescibacteria group bacterium]
MSETSRNLRKRMVNEFPNGNPLALIGVATQVLDLGLTADELFDYIVKDVARRLVMKFHPDRSVPESQTVDTELQRKYSEAYELLKNRTTFDRAMAEFRALRSEERNETKHLRRALEDARKKIERISSKDKELLSRERKLSVDTSKLAEAREIFSKEQHEQSLIVPKLENHIESMSDRYEKARLASSYHRKLFDGLHRYFSYLGDIKGSLGTHVLDARWVMVAVLLPKFKANKVIKPEDEGKWTEEFLKSVGHLEIPVETLEQVLERWIQMQKSFYSFPNLEATKYLHPRLCVMELSGAKPRPILGLDHPGPVGRIIGSIPNSLEQFDLLSLKNLVPRTTMFEETIPFVVEGGLLVSTMFLKTSKFHANDPGEAHFARETRRLILGVG